MASASASAPLLQSQHSGHESLESKSKAELWCNKFIDVEEAKAQLLFAIPMVLTNMSYFAIPLVSVMFAGHLGNTQLAGATLGNSWGTVTGLAVMTGLSGALETLCGQEYGAKSYRMLGIYLQSLLIITISFAIILSVLWWYSEAILIWLHQEPQVAAMAGLFLKYLIPGLFAYGFIQCLIRYYQTQSIVVPLMLFSLAPLIVHVGLTYLVVHVWGLGYKGTSLSASISLWLSFIMLALYVKYSEKFKHTWEGFSLESFEYLLPSFKLAIPSAIMVCFELWAFEVLVIVSGLLPNSELSTSIIAMCVNTEAIAFMITYGFSAAVSTRVSNEIGAGNIEKAKSAISVTLKLSVFLALAIVLILVLGHDVWASLFSSSNIIVREFGYITPLLAASIILDSAQGVLSGVARGCGWQHLAAWTNLFAFYLIGMPLAILFSFKIGLQTKGLWLGLICGLFCQACILLVITLSTKWTKLNLPLENEQNVDV